MQLSDKLWREYAERALHEQWDDAKIKAVFILQLSPEEVDANRASIAYEMVHQNPVYQEYLLQQVLEAGAKFAQIRWSVYGTNLDMK